MANKRTSVLRYARLLTGTVLLILLAVAAARALAPSQTHLGATLVEAAAPRDATGYARADAPRPFSFPRDHGPHLDYQTEWWYYTGNVTAPGGNRFGYQLTFFRRAVVPPDQRAERSSAWAVEQVYLAHFAVTEVGAGQHRETERLARGAAGLAGAQAQPYRVWLDDWSATQGDDGQVRLHAMWEGLAIDLKLRELKGPVLQGDAGYSRKGSSPGNASYYYSQTRLETTGTLTSGGQDFEVSGLSWMDHEYSTSSLEEGVQGWDWFSLQLDDGSELMLYLLRRADGAPNSFSSGTLVAPDGSSRRLALQDMVIRVTGRWRSPHSGATYPAGWELMLPDYGLRLAITPYLADQEMNVSYTYWEGAVAVEGTRHQQVVKGNGYVELSGYGRSLEGQF